MGEIDSGVVTAAQALERLKDGNQRFVTGDRSRDILAGLTRREQHLDGQRPIAVILGCSDSRVPVEIVFDQGLGDLFVIRIAGNIVASSQIGSVEFAAQNFGTRLVVVLGHTGCGAVQATVDSLTANVKPESEYVNMIVERIKPSAKTVLDNAGHENREALLDAAVRANVSAAANDLRHGSEILEKLARDDGLLIVGAEYSLETGEVDFFDGAASAG